MVTLHPNALKPGDYTVRSRRPAPRNRDVLPSHRDEHPNAYMIAQWVQHQELPGTIAAKGGWMYFTSDFHSLHPRKPTPTDTADAYVAARMKPYALCVLGGGHQLDLDLHNDWGDPWVQRSIAWRMQLDALVESDLSYRRTPLFRRAGPDVVADAAGRRIQSRHQPVQPSRISSRSSRNAQARSCRKARSPSPARSTPSTWTTGPTSSNSGKSTWNKPWNATRWATDSVNPEIRHDQSSVEQLRPRRHDRRRGHAAGPALRRAVRSRRLQRRRLRHDVPGAFGRGVPGLQPGQAALLPADVGHDDLGGGAQRRLDVVDHEAGGHRISAGRRLFSLGRRRRRL